MRTKRGPRFYAGLLLGAAALIYAGDFLSARFAFPHHRQIYGSVTVKKTYAVLQKNHKEEYYFLPPEVQTCLNSLFPHFGFPPCWYLKRRQIQQVQM
jgi:hypothetical protein